MLAERNCHSCTEHRSRHRRQQQRDWLPPPSLEFSVDEISRELVKLGVSETSPSRLIAIKRDLDELIRQDLEMARSQSSFESSAPHCPHRHRQALTSSGSTASTDTGTCDKNSSNINRSSCRQHRPSTRPDAEGDFPSSRNSAPPYEHNHRSHDQRSHHHHHHHRQQQPAETGHPDGQSKFKFHSPLQSASLESLESRLDYESWSSQSSTVIADESLNDLLSETIYVQDDDDYEEELDEGGYAVEGGEEEEEKQGTKEARSVDFEEKAVNEVLEGYQLLTGTTSTLCSHDLSPVSAPPSPREEHNCPAGPRAYSIKADQKVKFQHQLDLPSRVLIKSDEVQTGSKSARVERDQQHRVYPRPDGVQYLDLPSAYRPRLSKNLPDPKKLKKKLSGLFVPYHRTASDDTPVARMVPGNGGVAAGGGHLAPPLIPREQIPPSAGDKRRARKTRRRSTSNHLPTCSRHNAAPPTNQLTAMPKRKSVLRSRTRCLNADPDSCEGDSSGCSVVKRNRACAPRVRADPVTLFHAYKRQWRNTLVPGENDRRSLRWSVKAAMMIREIPVLPSSGRSVRSQFHVYPGSPRKRLSSSATHLPEHVLQ